MDWKLCQNSENHYILTIQPLGRLTHISGHPSATGRAQDGDRTLARDWRSTAEPRGPTLVIVQAKKRLCFSSLRSK